MDNTNVTNTQKTAHIRNNGGLPDFIVAMLGVGKILTANSWEVQEVSAQRISRIMKRKHIAQYKPKEICEKWEYYNCYIEDAEIKIEAVEVPIKYRSIPHYQFTFTKFSPKVEMVSESKPDLAHHSTGPHEPPRTTA